jgi:hypothetical protein
MCGISRQSTTRIAAAMPMAYPMVRAAPTFSCMMIHLIAHVNFHACIFPLTTQIESRNIMNVIRLHREKQKSRDRNGPED